ncbi:hypothetical protein HID58_090544 [Brassica napus]|uniref:Uncharacterized protein n=1 Tax=Brassica napus TaxID=3708 RepID=A0ABQ7WXY9_BRANA|nr:hypothetical protein HID58_090544 [Brassica napus]
MECSSNQCVRNVTNVDDKTIFVVSFCKSIHDGAHILHGYDSNVCFYTMFSCKITACRHRIDSLQTSLLGFNIPFIFPHFSITKKVVNPNREIVASRLVDSPEEVEDETTEPLPEMMFADGEKPVGVRVITYQSSRAIIVVVVSKRRRLELASVSTRSHRSRACLRHHRSRACPCHHRSRTRPRRHRYRWCWDGNRTKEDIKKRGKGGRRRRQQRD